MTETMEYAADDRLAEVFLKPIRKCADYRPAFGQGRSGGLKVSEFKALYGADAFYSWLGLDSPSVYAAHRAAGGLTSVYRQIGIGTERLFRAIIRERWDVPLMDMKWKYEYEKARGGAGVHTLDAMVEVSQLEEADRKRLAFWLRLAAREVASGEEDPKELKGAVFEVRQGYKSADSKRQNADLRFGIHAYRADLLPVFAIFSGQVSEPVIRRYRADGMLVLTGVMDDDPTISTFAFLKEVVGFDLPAFFDRNGPAIRSEVEGIVSTLLST